MTLMSSIHEKKEFLPTERQETDNFIIIYIICTLWLSPTSNIYRITFIKNAQKHEHNLSMIVSILSSLLSKLPGSWFQSDQQMGDNEINNNLDKKFIN